MATQKIQAAAIVPNVQYGNITFTFEVEVDASLKNEELAKYLYRNYNIVNDILDERRDTKVDRKKEKIEQGQLDIANDMAVDEIDVPTL